MKSTKEKQAESKLEQRCSIPFSRREFCMIAIIARAAMVDEDILETISPLSKFRSDDREIHELTEKLNAFLDDD